jgi:hypothetical protein
MIFGTEITFVLSKIKRNKPGYHFNKLFHVVRFDIHDVEALPCDFMMPEVDPQIVGRNKDVLVCINGD